MAKYRVDRLQQAAVDHLAVIAEVNRHCESLSCTYIAEGKLRGIEVDHDPTVQDHRMRNPRARLYRFVGILSDTNEHHVALTGPKRVEPLALVDNRPRHYLVEIRSRSVPIAWVPGQHHLAVTRPRLEHER